MIGLLASRSMNVNELAEALSMPVSTAALNVRQLEEAGLISTEIQPGIRGAMKLCSRRIDSVSLHLVPETQDGVSALTLKLPLGSYACARRSAPSAASSPSMRGSAKATRRARSTTRIVSPRSSCGLNPARSNTVSLGEIDPKQVEWLEISMEISSNAPMYREDFKSDIYVGLGARELGVWTSPAITARGAAASTRRGGAIPPPNTACSKRGASTASAARLTASRFQALPSRICSSTRWNTSPCASVFTRTRRMSAASTCSAKKFGDFAQGIVVRVGYAKAD